MQRIHVNRTALIAAAAGALLLLAACSSKSSSGGLYGSSSAGSGRGATPAASAVAISSAKAGSVGTVLVDQSGRTLYLFTPEKGSTVACTGSCATTWPPVLASSGAQAAAASGGAQSSMIGTVPLSGGQQEVTYNGWPLHTYSGDSAAGQANGQGIGGQWFTVTVAGSAAGSSGTGTTSTSGSSGNAGNSGGGNGGGSGNGSGGGYGGGY
jgi:predicted lipoprotein with Yx(FWY)xxD motif